MLEAHGEYGEPLLPREITVQASPLPLNRVERVLGVRVGNPGSHSLEMRIAEDVPKGRDWLCAEP